MNQFDAGLQFAEFAGLAIKADKAWEDYRVWNTAICEHFFGGQFRGKPVYIDLDGAALSRIYASAFGADGDAKIRLRDAVCGTTRSGGAADLFTQHIQLCRLWRRSKFDGYPPFAVLLALFSLVAESMIADEDFAPNNYYGRLATFLGLPVEEEDVIASYRSATEALWPALNTWLSSFEGALGYPTARALDHRIYVSVAISQALVRDQDRLLLRRMFDELGLAPGQRVGYDEMEGLLIHWVGIHSPNSSLFRLINKSIEIRRRVAELACAELEAWDGKSDRPQNQAVPATLVVVAQLRMEPLPSLNLFLSTLASFRTESSEVPYQLERSADVRTRSTFSADGGRYVMQHVDSPDIWSLEPWSSIKVSDALAIRVGFEPVRAGGRKLLRLGTQMLVLEYREREGLYREVSQASLMQKSIVLAPDAVASGVAEFLEKVARPGFRRYTATNLKGLPSMWTAFVDVYIVQTASTPGLEALCPRGSRALVPSGGLLLSNLTWHASATPEILAADTQAHSALQLSIHHTLQIANQQGTSRLIGEFVGAGAFDLSGQGLGDGDYELEVSEKRTILDRLSIRLRSSANARPWTLVGAPICHAVSEATPLGLLTATPVSENEDATATVVVGPQVVCNHPIAVALPIPNEPVGIAVDGDESHVDTLHDALKGGSPAHSESCVARGYHIWNYEYVSPGTPRGHLVPVTCTGCHLHVWQKVGGERSKRADVIPIRTEAKLLKVLPVAQKIWSAGHYRVVFDAVNYLRGGPFTQFASVVSYGDEDVWAPYEYARLLSSLCHIDVQVDMKTMRPRSWRMSPTRIVLLQDGAAVVAGWRSTALLSMIQQVATTLGGALSTTWWFDQLPVIRLTGLSAHYLEELCATISANSQEPVSLVTGFSSQLVGSLPRLSSVIEHLSLIRPAAEQLEIFDVWSARWEQVNHYDVVGAYRTKWRGLTYFFVSDGDVGQRQGRQGDSRLVKHLAGIAARIPIAQYDVETGVLRVPLGCEAPGLFGRVLAMASGAPPVRRSGRLEYQSVERNVAEQVLSRLTQ